jgi:hypothetical protein
VGEHAEVTVSERWARTDEQIAQIYSARLRGGICGWCGRELAPDEPVYIDLFRAGAKRLRSNGPVTHRSRTTVPVCAECASSEALQQAEGQEPDACVRCGRRVYYRQAHPLRRRTLCSRRCSSTESMARNTGRTVIADGEQPAPVRKVAFNVRIPADLHERLVAAAQQDGCSLSGLIVQVLGEWADLQPAKETRERVP